MNITVHFSENEAFGKCDVNKLAVSYQEAFNNAVALAMTLEQWRGVEGPISINSWARDIAQNIRLATDPASANRAATRAGPHCYGGAADCAILANEKLSGSARNKAYVASFKRLYEMTNKSGGLPVHEAILEFAGDNIRITHIHVQVRRDSTPGKRFITRTWKTDQATGKQEESYQNWTP